MNDHAEQIKASFEELKRGVTGLQADAARGAMEAVEDGLMECLAAINELELAVLTVLAGDER